MIDESSALNVFGGFFTKIARRTLLKNIIGVTLRYRFASVLRAVCILACFPYVCAGRDLCTQHFVSPHADNVVLLHAQGEADHAFDTERKTELAATIWQLFRDQNKGAQMPVNFTDKYAILGVSKCVCVCMCGRLSTLSL